MCHSEVRCWRRLVHSWTSRLPSPFPWLEAKAVRRDLRGSVSLLCQQFGGGHWSCTLYATAVTAWFFKRYANGIGGSELEM